VKQTGKEGAEIRVDLEVSLMDGRSRVEESSAELLPGICGRQATNHH